MQIAKADMQKASAFLIHIFTATGALWALLAMIAAARGEWVEMFAWLGVALFVDGVDGPLARKFEISERLPRWSGDALDYVIDYATYVFVPGFALFWSGILPDNISATTAAGIITVSSAIYFADTGMKTEAKFFRGFPAVWNAVIFLFFVFQPSQHVALGLIAFFGLLHFLPVWFIHPVRVKPLRPITLAVTIAWAVFATLALFKGMIADSDLLALGIARDIAEIDVTANFVKAGLALTSLYLAFIGPVLQAVQIYRRRARKKTGE